MVVGGRLRAYNAAMGDESDAIVEDTHQFELGYQTQNESVVPPVRCSVERVREVMKVV